MKVLINGSHVTTLKVLLCLVLFGLFLNNFRLISAIYIQPIWTRCHQIRTQLWWKVLQMCGNSEYNMFVWCTVIYSNAIFILFNLPFVAMDLTGKPEFLTKYKIQEGKNNPLTTDDLWKAVKVIFPNNTFSQLTPFVWYYLMKWRGIEYGMNLPTFQKVVLDLALCGLVEEILFYYSHRMLHHPLFYKRIHKLHHEWTAPISITCVYAHPVETLVSNTLPLLSAPLLIGSHYFTWMVWMALTFAWTIKDHSGYHFPILPSSEAHDYHHLKFNQNYGVLGILDWLHGTDQLYRKTVQFERDHAFFSIQSAREMIPDRKR